MGLYYFLALEVSTELLMDYYCVQIGYYSVACGSVKAIAGSLAVLLDGHS